MGIHTDPAVCSNRRVVKPLRQEAVKTADKAQPTCTNDEERRKWIEAYVKAAGQGSWECACPKGKEPGSIIQPCRNNKSIEIFLRRKQRTMEHEWWPTDVGASYHDEEYALKHTDGDKDGKLYPAGNVEVKNIPGGSCVIAFPRFYSEIEVWIKEQLQQ